MWSPKENRLEEVEMTSSHFLVNNTLYGHLNFSTWQSSSGLGRRRYRSRQKD